jgi:hypothetical protein
MPIPALLLAAALAQGPSSTTSPPPAVVSAGDAAFQRGDFQSAFMDYNDAIADDPNDAEAILGLGTLDLYRNDWENARTYLSRARRLAPQDPRVETRLATLRARLPKPDRYTFHFTNGQTDIPFVSIDPVPVVHATIDGKTLAFIVDTTAGSVALTPQAAQSLGIADGGTIDKLVFPGLTVNNVGAEVLAGPLSAGTTPVDGAIGTIFLSHFLPTFDYAHNRLRLRLWEASPGVEKSAVANGATIEPMWLVGDRLLVASARIDGGPAMMFALQTGNADGAVAMNASDVPASLPLVSLGHYTQGPLRATTLSEEAFSGVPFHVGGALRSSFFRAGTLTLDFTKMNVIVK